MLRLALAASLLLSLLVAGLDATVLVPAALPDLTASATVIVRGRVVALTPQWRDGRRGIDTVVTLEADEYLKGRLGRELTFKVPGGQVGPYRSLMVGAPGFTEGEQVIVFLKGAAPAQPYVVGFNQGVYRVRTDDGGVARVRAGAAGQGTDGAGAATRNPTLDQFTARVRALVAGAGR